MRLLFLLPFLFTLSCKQESMTDKAKKEIKLHLSKTMHDFKSYEPVEFSTLDTLYSSYTESNNYKIDMLSFDEYTTLSRHYTEYVKLYTKYYYSDSVKKYNGLAKETLAKADSVNQKMIKERKGFNPQFIGYTLLHSFRGKNMNGAMILKREKFQFDSTMKFVMATELKDLE